MKIRTCRMLILFWAVLWVAVSMLGACSTYRAHYDIGLMSVERSAQAVEKYGAQDITTFEDFKKLNLIVGLATEKGVQVGENEFLEVEAPIGKLVPLFITDDKKIIPFKIGGAFVSLDKEVAPGSKVT